MTRLDGCHLATTNQNNTKSPQSILVMVKSFKCLNILNIFCERFNFRYKGNPVLEAVLLQLLQAQIHDSNYYKVRTGKTDCYTI